MKKDVFNLSFTCGTQTDLSPDFIIHDNQMWVKVGKKVNDYGTNWVRAESYASTRELVYQYNYDCENGRIEG